MKQLNRIFAGAILLIMTLSFISAYLFVTGISYTLGFLCLCGISYVGLLLYKRFTRNTQRMLHFFTALKNSDFTMDIPLQKTNKIEDELAEEMNRIMALARKQQKIAEERSLYSESLLKVMTHEVRNAITPISSLSELLLTECRNTDNKTLLEDLDTIYQQSKLLNSFLEAYHKLVYLPEPEIQTVDMHSFFRKMERLFVLEPGIDRVTFPMNQGIRIQTDPNLLTLALINLIRNALQALEGQSDGRVIIRTKTSSSFCIEIEDNGPGIAPELQTAIFVPFFSTKKTGSGIGLSIAQRIMQVHGGELTVVSRPGQTVFTLRFLF